MKCLNCSSSLVVHKPRRPKKFCNTKCKDSYAYKMEKESRPAEKVKVCPTCKVSFQVPFSSRVQYCSRACQPNRIAFKAKQIFHPCKRCSAQTFVRRTYCPPCWQWVQSEQKIPRIYTAEKTRKERRRKRESEAPGLTRRQLDRLLATWKAERQPCVYCYNLANTIDHIVPLTRNGTNFEDNLAPCCRSCNSSKASKLILEWKGIHVSTKAK